MPTYPRNALNKVLARLEWPDEATIAEAAVTGIAAALQNLLPTHKKDVVSSVQVQVAGNDPHALPATIHKTHTAHRFLSTDEKQIVLLDPTGVTFEWNTYQTFDAFRAVFDVVITLLAMASSGAPNARALSMRKINVVRGSTGSALDFNGFIHDSLTAAPSFPYTDERLARSVGLNEYRHDSGSIRQRYGWFNPEYPNRIARREYVLDLEYTHEEPLPLVNASATLIAANRKLDDVFEASIGPKMRDWLNGENNL